MTYKKPELLIPASSLEVLKTAVMFGADAVYIGGEAFGLRAKAKNFSSEEMAEGVAFAHAHGVKVYVTANILAHNYDLDGARKYFAELRDMKPEQIGLIIRIVSLCGNVHFHLRPYFLRDHEHSRI
jgi:U32 family peptidase